MSEVKNNENPAKSAGIVSNIKKVTSKLISNSFDVSVSCFAGSADYFGREMKFAFYSSL